MVISKLNSKVILTYSLKCALVSCSLGTVWESHLCSKIIRVNVGFRRVKRKICTHSKHLSSVLSPRCGSKLETSFESLLQ